MLPGSLMTALQGLLSPIVLYFVPLSPIVCTQLEAAIAGNSTTGDNLWETIGDNCSTFEP